MRDKYKPRPAWRRWRPSDSFAYAGGDIRHLTSEPPDPTRIGPLSEPGESNELLPQNGGDQNEKEPNLAMDNPCANPPQPEPNAADNAQSETPRRRKRTFPVTFRVAKDDKGRVVDTQMFYAHEWAEYQAAQQAAERARQETEDAARAAREAELAASRPDFPNRESDLPHTFPVNRAASARSALIASTPAAHVLTHVPPDYERHSRLCSICSHPDRDAIEGDFVRWRKPAEIIDDYGLSSRYALYRHAHAVGLYQRREIELARVLEKQLENADDCPLEQFDVITRAVRAHAHLDGYGRWHEPTRTHHILTGPLPSGATPDPSPTFDVAVNLPNPG